MSRASAPQIVHASAGAPAMEECAPASGVCWQCGGEVVRGVALARWLSDSHGSHTRVSMPTSDVVCEACVFVGSRTSPVPGRPPQEGKQFGGNFRNYSHFGESGDDGAWSVANASKGEKDVVRSFLTRPRRGAWFCAVAETGQKHVLPFTPTNHRGDGGGRVAFDDRLVSVPDPRTLDSLIRRTTALLTAGATKEDVESGDYSDRSWSLCEDMIREYERDNARIRGGGLLALVVWLAQRDEAAVQSRMAAEKEVRAAARQAKGRRDADETGAHGGAARPRRRAARLDAETGAPSGAVTAQAVRPDHESTAPSDGDGREPERVRDPLVSLPWSGDAEQLRLL